MGARTAVLSHRYRAHTVSAAGLQVFQQEVSTWLPVVLEAICPAELAKRPKYKVERPAPPTWSEMVKRAKSIDDWGARLPPHQRASSSRSPAGALEAPVSQRALHTAAGGSTHTGVLECAPEALPPPGASPADNPLSPPHPQAGNARPLQMPVRAAGPQEGVAREGMETRATKPRRAENSQADGEERLERASLAERAEAFLSRPGSRLVVTCAMTGPNQRIAFASAFASAHTAGAAAAVDLQVRPGLPLPRVTGFACTDARAAAWGIIEGLCDADEQAARSSQQLREVRVLTSSAGAAAIFTAAVNTLPSSSKSEWAISEHEDLQHIISGLTTSLRRKNVRCSVWCVPTEQWPAGYVEELVSAVEKGLELDYKVDWRLTETGPTPRDRNPEEVEEHMAPPQAWPYTLAWMVRRWYAQLLRYQDGLRTRASARGPALCGDRPSGPTEMAQLTAQLADEMGAAVVPPEPGRPSDILQAAPMDDFLDYMDRLPPVDTAGQPLLAQTPWRYPTFTRMDPALLQRPPMRSWDAELGKGATALHGKLNRLLAAMAQDLAEAAVPVRRGIYAFLCLLTWMLAGDEQKPRGSRIDRLLRTVFLDPAIAASREVNTIRGYDDVEGDIRALLRERARQHIEHAKAKRTAQRTSE